MTAFDKFKDADIPLVFFDKVPDGKSYNKVCIADKEAATLAAKLLLEKNKKNILAIFGNISLSITRSRLQAFNLMMASKKEVINNTEHCNSSAEAKDITDRFFSKKEYPDAVFCMSDEILIGVMKSLNELKIQIPAKTAVLALSNGFLPKLYYPEITYIETSGYKLGKLAFTSMMNCIDGKTEPVELFTKSPLVKGKSL
jgi:LacI family transcriptional regulator